MKKILKAILTVFFLFVLTYSIYDLFRGETYSLKVKATPEGSLIKVNTAGESVNLFEKRLKKGRYTVIAEKEGYITITREVDLTSNLNIEINLKTTFPTNLEKETIENTTIGNIVSGGNNKLYGISKRDGKLLLFTNGQTETIYQNRVKDFSVSGETIALIDQANQAEVVIINTTTKAQRKINLIDYSPIISVSLSSDAQTLYLLGNFSISNKTPTLYSTNINDINLSTILETRGLDVEYVKDDRILLLEMIHATDQSIVHLVNLKSKQSERRYNANSFQISPDRNKIIMQLSNSITVVNTNDFSINTTQILNGKLAAWKDDNNIIILDNTRSGIEVGTLTLNPSSFSTFQPFIPDTMAKSVYGITNGILYFQDYKGKITGVKLP